MISVRQNSMLCDDGVILSVRILKWAKFSPCMRVSLKSYDGFVKRFRLCVTVAIAIAIAIAIARARCGIV